MHSFSQTSLLRWSWTVILDVSMSTATICKKNTALTSQNARWNKFINMGLATMSALEEDTYFSTYILVRSFVNNHSYSWSII